MKSLGDYALLRTPVPALGRLMAFVDGENLVCRFQAMRDAGRIPHDDMLHIPDVVAWRPTTVQAGLNVVLRTTSTRSTRREETTSSAPLRRLSPRQASTWSAPSPGGGC